MPALRLSWVAEELVGQRQVLAGGRQRRVGRQVGPGGVAAHGEAGRIGAEVGRVLDDPAVRRVRVVVAGREPVLGTEPVVDRQHPHAAALGQEAAGGVVGVEVAVHEAAAVEEHQQRAGRRGVGRDVQPAGQVAHRQAADRPDRVPAAGHRGVTYDGPPPLGDRQRLRAPFAGEALEAQDQLGVGRERLAVADDRSAREPALDGLGKVPRRPDEQGLESKVGGDGAGLEGHAPEPTARKPGQPRRIATNT
jgi:hypothetical protein